VRRRSSPVPSGALKSWIVRAVFAPNILGRGRIVQASAGLVLLGLDEVSVDRLFAQCLARFEAMQTVYEDEAITIAPHQNGCLLSDFQNTLRDLLDGLWFERCAALIGT
jgi:hypothetical protein